MLREVPYMGVIRVLADAARVGYRPDAGDWRNLGQGQPEVGPLPGAPERVEALAVAAADHAYGAVAGLEELREAVASYYNSTYRADAGSLYTAENVAITPGGRAGLARVFAALAPQAAGCFSPDYPAYVDLFRDLGAATAHPIDLSPADGFAIRPESVAAQVTAMELDLLLFSNPGNPTGRVIDGPDLARLIDVALGEGCALLVDEFYSHYVYDGRSPVSASAHVGDVDMEPILLFDGLTKNFRYPGWRIGWVVGPRALIETVVSVGSYLDGGASRFVQRAALEVLEPQRARRETDAVRAAFEPKRDLVMWRLTELGLHVPRPPQGTFYAFASVSELPPPLNTSQGFFNAALGEQLIVVPGEYFDMDAGGRGPGNPGYDSFVRISFGAPHAEVADGLDRIERLITGAHRRAAA